MRLREDDTFALAGVLKQTMMRDPDLAITRCTAFEGAR